ncbi:MAG: hypothetical protein AAGD25_32350 [Cyanobacteria bacterium P01_F01_bin.150]
MLSFATPLISDSSFNPAIPVPAPFTLDIPSSANISADPSHRHREWVRGVDVSANGHVIASGSFDHTIKLWDTQPSRCIQTLQGHSHQVYAVWFSPQASEWGGDRFASSSSDETAKLWKLSSSTCLQTYQATMARMWAGTKPS